MALKTKSNIIFTIINYICFIVNSNLYYFNTLVNIQYYLINYNNIDIYYNHNNNNLYIKNYYYTNWGNNFNNKKLITNYLFSLLDNLDITNSIL